MAIENMAKDGCEWSLLFTGVNAHYERYGWKTLKTRYRHGLLQDKQKPFEDWRVMPINPISDRNSLERIQEVYEAYNQSRPLTNVRSPHYWETAVLPRMTQPGFVTYTACLGECRKASAYAVAQTDEESLIIKEIGVLPGCEESLLAVMDVVRELAVHREVNNVRAYLPFEQAANEAVHRLIKDVQTEYHSHVMARPLTTGLSFEDIQDLFLSDRAKIWPLDDF